MVCSSGEYVWPAPMESVDGLLQGRVRWSSPIKRVFAPVRHMDGLLDWRLWIVCSTGE
jgi:hypothetical protein